MKKTNSCNWIVIALLTLFAVDTRAEGILGFLAHEATHHAEHHSPHKNTRADNNGGGGEVMAQDDSLFGNVEELQSKTICLAQYFKERRPTFNNQKLTAKTKLGCFDYFTVMHSGVTRSPLWSAEHLTRENLVSASHMKRENSFHAEARLPPSERAELSDFKSSGLDRGHMSPSADEPNKLSQYQSFSLANMTAQNAQNNRNLHEGIESAVRTFAKQNGELYVITGPMFIGSNLRMLHGHVMVPTFIFKAVLDPLTGHAAAYLEKNEEGMDYKVISIAELERISGINFFPSLSNNAKNIAMVLPVPTPHH